MKYFKSISVVECPDSICDTFFILLLTHPCTFFIVEYPVTFWSTIFIDPNYFFCTAIVPAGPFPIQTIFFICTLFNQNHTLNKFFLKSIFKIFFVFRCHVKRSVIIEVTGNSFQNTFFVGLSLFGGSYAIVIGV